MSDIEVQFEEPNEGDMEIVQLDDGEDVPAEEAPVETGPKKIELTAEEYQALVNRPDGSAALGAGLKELGERLAPRPMNQMAPQDDFDPAKLEEEAFKPGKFSEVVSKIAARATSQIAGQSAVALQQQSKKILKLDPNTSQYYSKFEAEIEKRVANLPPQARYMPDIYERVYRDVVSDNQTVLINEKAQEIADAAVKKALAEAGVGQAAGSGKKPAVYSESVTTPRVAAAKRTVYLTQADKQDMIESSMDPADKDQVVAYLDWKKRKQGGNK